MIVGVDNSETTTGGSGCGFDCVQISRCEHKWLHILAVAVGVPEALGVAVVAPVPDALGVPVAVGVTASVPVAEMWLCL